MKDSHRKAMQDRLDDLERANKLYIEWVNNPDSDYYQDKILIRLIDKQRQEIALLTRLLS